MKIRILIVDDHRIFREGLKTLLNMQTDMEVIGEAENGIEAIATTRKLIPDIIIMDAKMPIMNGAEATRLILAEMPGMKILAHSIYSGDEFVTVMMHAGARGYILKGGDFLDLIDTIRRTALNLS
jgi:DNA-binding NarL/FixJ family response regulator